MPMLRLLPFTMPIRMRMRMRCPESNESHAYAACVRVCVCVCVCVCVKPYAHVRQGTYGIGAATRISTPQAPTPLLTNAPVALSLSTFRWNRRRSSPPRLNYSLVPRLKGCTPRTPPGGCGARSRNQGQQSKRGDAAKSIRRHGTHGGEEGDEEGAWEDGDEEGGDGGGEDDGGRWPRMKFSLPEYES